MSTTEDSPTTSHIKEELPVAFARALSMVLSALDSTIDWLRLQNFEETSRVVTVYVKRVPWKSVTVLAPICVSAVLIPIFIFVETKLGIGAAFFSVNVDLPQSLQVVDNRRPIRAGVSMLPILVPVGLISPLAAIMIVKTRSYCPLLWISTAFGPVGAGLISTLNGGADVIGGARTSYPHLYRYEIILGLSLGMTITVSTIIIQMSVKPASVGIATGFQALSRTIGGLIGLAVSTAVPNARVDSKLHSTFPDASTRQKIAEGPIAIIPSLSPQLQAAVRQVYNSGSSLIFVIIAGWFSIGSSLAWG
ncbi:hypothetical protein NEOLEDRAFT_1144856 [Neolentinus lepideus HHB14362 ss-1]|uniref:MFS general substrate transporter n=1 Tax=Neolentinus lepideus HHB14362 ss-1 TaxID=1314782 RepID=A0A165VJH3_9AGAM|nr:hypothetical protein NEOLEDRAFT_1144856 [Neolentinus lepideus HHB14362 ss-1]